MSAADRMVVRTQDGFRSLPRRIALAWLANGRARGPQAPAEQPEAAVMPPTPDEPPTPPQRAQDGAGETSADSPDDVPELHEVDELDAGDDDVPTVDAVELAPLPRGNAGRAEWAEYAQTELGLAVTSDQTRNDIRDAAQEAHAAALARLPQPAVTDGGRLETPEDEPATETVADDPDTRTR